MSSTIGARRGAGTSAVRPIIGMHDDLFRRACRLAGGIRDLWPMPLSARPIRLGDQEGPDHGRERV